MGLLVSLSPLTPNTRALSRGFRHLSPPSRCRGSCHGLDVSFPGAVAISLFPDCLYPPCIIIDIIIRPKVWLINSPLKRPLTLYIKILKVLLTLGWWACEFFTDFLSGLERPLGALKWVSKTLLLQGQLVINPGIRNTQQWAENFPCDSSLNQQDNPTGWRGDCCCHFICEGTSQVERENLPRARGDEWPRWPGQHGPDTPAQKPTWPVGLERELYSLTPRKPIKNSDMILRRLSMATCMTSP